MHWRLSENTDDHAKYHNYYNAVPIELYYPPLSFLNSLFTQSNIFDFSSSEMSNATQAFILIRQFDDLKNLL